MSKEFAVAYVVTNISSKIGFVFGSKGTPVDKRTQGQATFSKYPDSDLIQAEIQAEDHDFDMSFDIELQRRGDVYFFETTGVSNAHGTFEYDFWGYPVMYQPGNGNTIYGSFTRRRITAEDITEEEETGQWGSGNEGL